MACMTVVPTRSSLPSKTIRTASLEGLSFVKVRRLSNGVFTVAVQHP